MITAEISNYDDNHGSKKNEIKYGVRLPRLCWLAAWLFTVGFAGLGFWQGFFAVFIWPYYLGDAIKDLIIR